MRLPFRRSLTKECGARRSRPGGGPDAAPILPAIRGSSERWLVVGVVILILLALAIRVPLLVNIKLEPDETEHLYPAWAIAHGQVPYKDFWQLHPPLFYYLMAPLFTLMGDDLRIIYVARGLMLLCLLLILLECYRIAKECFDPLTGLLAVLLLSYLLLWWRPAYEVRPDIPQTLLVLVSLRWFMRAWARRRRIDFLLSGALLGVAFWLLLKTLFPFFGLTLVFGLSSMLRRSATAIRENLTGLLLFLGAFAVLVVVGGLLLWVAGMWPGFVQWVVIGGLRWPDRFSPFILMRPRVRFGFWALALVGVGLTLTRMLRARGADEVRLSPLLAGSVTAVIWLFLMPAPYLQSALPILPLAAMYGADVVRRVIARAVPPGGAASASEAALPAIRTPARLAWAGLAVLLVSGACLPPLLAVLIKLSPFRDHWPERRQLIHDVLALTSPEDAVFDPTGLSILRPHATYHYRIIEPQRIWLQTGMLREGDIINDLLKSQCKVVIFSTFLIGAFPNLSEFLLSHYVPTRLHDRGRRVMVAGRTLRRADLPPNGATVSLVASTEYAVRAVGGRPRVYIDGQLYRAPRFLEQGDHHIIVEGEFDSLTILYSRALAVSAPATRSNLGYGLLSDRPHHRAESEG